MTDPVVENYRGNAWKTFMIAIIFHDNDSSGVQSKIIRITFGRLTKFTSFWSSLSLKLWVFGMIFDFHFDKTFLLLFFTSLDC